MERIRKVVFYFPWKEISGGPVYLTQLANDLAVSGEYEVFYVDYTPGLTDCMLTRQVKKIDYAEPFFMPVDEPLLLVVPIYCAGHIPKLHPKSRILFLNWHNYCIQALLDSWRLSGAALQEFLGIVRDTHSVFFLDRTHWEAQNRWMEGKYEFEKAFVPVKVSPAGFMAQGELAEAGKVNIVALGRLSKDKIYSVLDLITQMEASKCALDMHLYVIGEGTEEKRLEERMSKSRIHIHRMGTVTGDALRHFLAERADMLFSMGMSALEGAAVGIPSVIMPHNIEPFHADAYVYLHQSVDYALGWYDTQLSELSVPARPFQEILDDVCRRGKKQSLGKAARAYLEQNHASNVGRLKPLLDGTSLDYDTFWRFARRQRRIRVLGVPIARIETSFDEHEKRIAFLGHRAFLRCRIDGDERTLFLLERRITWLIAQKEGEKYRLYARIPFLKA